MIFMTIVSLACLLLLTENLQKRSFALQFDHKAVLLRRRVTQLTKHCLNAQQQGLHDCKLAQKNCGS